MSDKMPYLDCNSIVHCRCGSDILSYIVVGVQPRYCSFRADIGLRSYEDLSSWINNLDDFKTKDLTGDLASVAFGAASCINSFSRNCGSSCKENMNFAYMLDAMVNGKLIGIDDSVYNLSSRLLSSRLSTCKAKDISRCADKADNCRVVIFECKDCGHQFLMADALDGFIKKYNVNSNQRSKFSRADCLIMKSKDEKQQTNSKEAPAYNVAAILEEATAQAKPYNRLQHFINRLFHLTAEQPYPPARRKKRASRVKTPACVPIADSEA